jgi:hypothetical protein
VDLLLPNVLLCVK